MTLRAAMSCLMAASLWCAGPASAQSEAEPPQAEAAEGDHADARRAFDEATDLFEEGNYALSIQSFERSHSLMEGEANQYLILFNIGRCQEELGQDAQALETYDRYLREGGSSYHNGDETRRRVQELRERQRMSEENAPSVAPGPSGLLIGGIVLEAVGGVAGIVSLVTGLLAHDLYTQLEASCVPVDACPPGSADDISTGDGLAWTSTILLPLAAVAVGVGSVLLVLDLTSGSEESSATLQLSPTLGGAQLRGTF